MGAYRKINVLLKGYAVGNGSSIEGYFKINNKDITGYNEEGSKFRIPLSDCRMGYQHFTLIGFTFDLEGNFQSSLEKIIVTKDLNKSSDTTEVAGQRLMSGDERTFFDYLLALLKERAKPLFTQTLTIKGNRTYSAYKYHLLGFPEEFKKQFSKALEEKDTRRAYGAYAFERLSLEINPEDWGQSKTQWSRRKSNGGRWDYFEPHPDM